MISITHARKPSRPTTTLFTVSKDEWNTKEDTGWSMKNASYILRYTKRHIFGWSDIKQEKIKLVALAIIKLCLSLNASVSQTRLVIYQLVSQEKFPFSKFKKKICSNFLKEFWVDLKAFLGLVLSNQYHPIVVWKNWGWFLGGIILWATPTPSSFLLWATIVVHDNINIEY